MNKNRYEFYKRLFPNKLIVYNDKGKLTSLKIDKDILMICKYNEVSKVVVDKEDNVEIIEVENNKYRYYLMKVWVWELLDK